MKGTNCPEGAELTLARMSLIPHPHKTRFMTFKDAVPATLVLCSRSCFFFFFILLMFLDLFHVMCMSV